jgi:hypothetical protein
LLQPALKTPVVDRLAMTSGQIVDLGIDRIKRSTFY